MKKDKKITAKSRDFFIGVPWALLQGKLKKHLHKKNKILRTGRVNNAEKYGKMLFVWLHKQQNLTWMQDRSKIYS